MSSFMVNAKTIDRILSDDVACDLRDEKELTAMGRKMLRLNLDALVERYEDRHDHEERYKLIVRVYKFEWVPVSHEQALKSLHCWLYQCTEGSVPGRKLYRLWDRASHVLADHIVQDTQAYQSAEWG